MITLRPYQERDLEAMRAALKAFRSVLYNLPCGGGKGTVCSYIVQSVARNKKRSIFLVDRRALVDDMSDRLNRLSIPHGVIMASDSRRAPWESTHVASIDTITRRDHPPHADFLLIDEARFSLSPKWIKVLNLYPRAKIIGFDATPARTDGQGLGAVFEHMVVGPSAQELINDGFLVRSHVIAPPPVEAPSKVVAGEFAASAVSAACDTNKIIGDVLKHWKSHAIDRKTVGFGADQKHCLHMAETFREAGIEAATVFDNTPTDDRRRMFRDFKDGGLRVMFTVSVIGYGVDLPICKAIIDAAHTMSLPKAIQRWARGSRPYKDFDRFILLDHVGNLDRRSPLAPNGFGFYEDDRIWSLDGKAIQIPEDGDTSRGVTQCRNCYHRYRAGAAKCPACGFIVPVKYRDMKVVDQDLQERKRAEQKTMAVAEWRSKLDDDGRRAQYEKWKSIGEERGYSEKWCKVTYMKVFNEWPSRKWDREPEMEPTR